ncbi:hypothetical protein MTO96_035398 [Rhipicephalus appendiculatus]
MTLTMPLTIPRRDEGGRKSVIPPKKSAISVVAKDGWEGPEEFRNKPYRKAGCVLRANAAGRDVAPAVTVAIPGEPEKALT